MNMACVKRISINEMAKFMVIRHIHKYTLKNRKKRRKQITIHFMKLKKYNNGIYIYDKKGNIKTNLLQIFRMQDEILK